MCGIVGVYWYRGGRADAALVGRQTRALHHRGPDDSGTWSEGEVALGQARLAIVDRSPAGHQPMASEAGTSVVVFNGEIYNWIELREELTALGRRFRGETDTEVLLHLWEERGAALVDPLRGMFAFALYDRRARLLQLVRDRAGEKPLYYHDDGHRLAFASELKALLLDPSVPRDVEPTALADMLTLGYIPGPRTVYRNVFRLPPGHRLVCNPYGVKLERYWSFPVEASAPVRPQEAVERVRARMLEAVRLRLRADVPLGVFLSGGMDSSAVVALMAQASGSRIRTFSIGFEWEASSELEHARVVARHFDTEHHERIVRPDALRTLPTLVWGFDEPFADDSMLPTYELSALAASHVGVALSGDGGDEAFAGYTTYPRAVRHARADFLPAVLRQNAARVASLLPPEHRVARRIRRLGRSVVDRHMEGMSRYSADQLERLLTGDLRAALVGHNPFAPFRSLHAHAARSLEPVAALVALDAQTYLVDDVLFKVDRMSMLNSLEVRAPLLDHILVEEVARLPFSLKMRRGVTKWVMREAMRPFLPPGILARRKQGFSTPLAHWMDLGLVRLAREVLLDARCRTRGWLDPREVERLVDGSDPTCDNRAHRLFTVLCLELWAQAWLDRPREAMCESAPR